VYSYIADIVVFVAHNSFKILWTNQINNFNSWEQYLKDASIGGGIRGSVSVVGTLYAVLKTK